MSGTLLLAPHADDESLFASYLAQRHKAHVAVIYDEDREDELRRATVCLGCSYEQLPLAKGAPEDMVEAYLIGLRKDWEYVIAPDIEKFGHEEHNLVGQLALTVFREIPIIRYRMYAPRGTRSQGDLVIPDSSDFIANKLAALSCYRSQIEISGTRPWFYDLLDMREFVA